MINKKVQEIILKLFKENNLAMYSEKNVSNFGIPTIYILESLENKVFASKEAFENENNFREKYYIQKDYVEIIEETDFFGLSKKYNFNFKDRKNALKILGVLLLNIPLKDVKKINLFI